MLEGTKGSVARELTSVAVVESIAASDSPPWFGLRLVLEQPALISPARMPVKIPPKLIRFKPLSSYGHVGQLFVVACCSDRCERASAHPIRRV
jgi:hypothetical protein